MSLKLYVIAGSLSQFHEFRLNKLETSYWHQTMFPNAQDWVYVSSADKLRGCTVEHGVFYGSWKQIHNLEGIFRQLIMQAKDQHTRDNLNRIYSEWHDWLAEGMLNINYNVPQPQPMVLPQTIQIKATPHTASDMDFL
jgi:hypothetical protein